MTAGAKVRLDIVGAGGILKRRLRVVDATERAQLTAVCDIALERANAVARERGQRVLTEKPLAADIGSARTMIQAAGRAGACLAVNVRMRANPVFQSAREVVQGGELGAVHRAAWTSTA